MVDTIPPSIQQIPILWSLLYFSYVFGEKSPWSDTKGKRFRDEDNDSEFIIRQKKEIEPWFANVLRFNLISVALLYSLAIYMELIVLSSPEEEIDTTKRWMQEHDDLFWFVLALHQSFSMGMIAMEILGKEKMKNVLFLGAVPPLIQWTVGLFAGDAMTGAIVGLVFEMLTPMLAIIYTFKTYCSKQKIRALYGLLSVLAFIVSMVPVFFLARDMKSANHAVFFTVVFGMACFFFSAKLLKRSKKIARQVSEFSLETMSPTMREAGTHTLE